MTAINTLVGRAGLEGNPAYITRNGPDLNLLNEAGDAWPDWFTTATQTAQLKLSDEVKRHSAPHRQFDEQAAGWDENRIQVAARFKLRSHPPSRRRWTGPGG
jgi:hypothetical protein